MLDHMGNPWLDVPLEDYEAHMALPYVGQAPLLADLLGKAVDEHEPRSVAILGCAGGNGLERMVGTPVRRVVGIDINPDYVERTRLRFEKRIPGLELLVGDVQTDALAFEPVQLVFAGLFFEYVDVATTLDRIRSMLSSSGVLVAVLQLPSTVPEVTPSPYVSLGALSSLMRLVPPERMAELAEKAGFRLAEAYTVEAGSGKRFGVQAFSVTAPTGRRRPIRRAPDRSR